MIGGSLIVSESFADVYVKTDHNTDQYDNSFYIDIDSRIDSRSHLTAKVHTNTWQCGMDSCTIRRNNLK